MKKLCLNLLILCAVITVGADVARSQSASKASFNPPSWILGEWANSAESNLNNLETFVFTSHEIKLIKGIGGKSKALEFSRKFKDYQIKETIGPEIYRVELYADGNTFVYEFKPCETEACKTFSGKESLTYSIIKNKNVVRPHMTSVNLVLFRPRQVQ